eukprot:SAG31_NODE_16699_length_699_cov_1.105000_1_plen_46_part_10
MVPSGTKFSTAVYIASAILLKMTTFVNFGLLNLARTYVDVYSCRSK